MKLICSVLSNLRLKIITKILTNKKQRTVSNNPMPYKYMKFCAPNLELLFTILDEVFDRGEPWSPWSTRFAHLVQILADVL